MRRICVITLLVCLVLLPLAGKAQTYMKAQAYYTIGELRESIPERWTQTYETKWRKVSIDVQPTLPQVDKLPILKVIPDFRPLDISGLGEGWSRWEVNDRATFAAFQNDLDQEERDAKGETTTTNYYPPFDMSASYAQNNDLTLNDVLNHLMRIMDAMGEDQGQWQYDRPTRIFVNTTVSRTTGKPLLPGSYSVSLHQKLQGVPVLCHALNGVDSPKDQEMWFHAGLTFQIRTPESVSLGGKEVTVKEVLADDVPLCDFSKVKSAIEEEIQAGHIRKIFDVELGYALYNEPGVSRKPGLEWLHTAMFYAVPVWQVNCYYVENGQKELRDYKDLDVPERAAMEYKTLIVNAQTGVAMDRSDNRKGCGDYLGFISWEEVGGKQ